MLTHRSIRRRRAISTIHDRLKWRIEELQESVTLAQRVDRNANRKNVDIVEATLRLRAAINLLGARLFRLRRRLRLMPALYQAALRARNQLTATLKRIQEEM